MTTPVKKEGESRSPLGAFFDKGLKGQHILLPIKSRNAIGTIAYFYSRKYKSEKCYVFFPKNKKFEEYIKIILL